MSQNPPLDANLRDQMATVICEGVETYLTEFTSRLFPEYEAADAQDCVVEGFARAIKQYQSRTGRPIAHAVALSLLEDQ